MLLPGTPAGAKGASKLIHLTGVVEGPTHSGTGEDCSFPSKLNLLEGQRSVGVIHFGKCILFSASDLKYRGSVKLAVGRLSGKLRVGINFLDESQGPVPYGQGPVWKMLGHRRVAEGIRVKRTAGSTPIPTRSNARLEVLLKPSGKFPSQIG